MILPKLGKTVSCAILILMLINPAFTQTKPEPCIDAKLKENVQKLILDAIDSAFMTYIANLFQVWLKDNDVNSYRAGKGMVRGIYAYQRARDNALKWDPPICKK